MRLSKLTLQVDGLDGPEIPQNSPAIYERQIMRNGKERLMVLVPPEQPDLFLKLACVFREPFFVLYILHTPRGEGEPGRYQSPELRWVDLKPFLKRFEAFLAGDARHDIWVYSLETAETIVWDRHNYIFIESDRLEFMSKLLSSMGFGECPVKRLQGHNHYYRQEFDCEATELLAVFDWHRTPLRPEDEQ